MKKLRVARIQFDEPIKGKDISSFRGAIIDKLENANELFHNHKEEGYRYNYPLIQYKRISQKAAIVCLDEGVDSIHEFFNQNDWKLNFGDSQINFELKDLHLNQFNLQIWNRYFHYNIFKWLALNQENYKKYTDLPGEEERLYFLGDILRGNIMSFCKGIGYHADKEIKVDIEDIIRTKVVPFKNIKLQAFDVRFKTNMFLPEYIGLGKGVSLGYGTVRVNKQ